MEAARARDQRGDTLIEVMIALVIISIVISALFTSYATASTATKNYRDLVTADAVLRDSAEATKAAVKTQCAGGGTTYSVTFSAPAGSGITPPANITNAPCPPVTGPISSQVPTVTLNVTTPSNAVKTLAIAVRTP